MAKKTAKGKTKTRTKKPRPRLTAVRKEMARLRDDLKVIIAAKEDKQGKLNPKQLEKAKKTKAALDVALAKIQCVQLLIAY